MENGSFNNLPEESAEDLYENAPFGYVSFLADGTIFKINKTLLNLLGYKKEEVVQQKKIQTLFGIGGRIYFETHFFPLIRMQGFVKEVNFDLVKKDGSVFPALLNVNQLSASKPGIFSYRTSVIDITDRKKFEKVLVESKEKAEKATRAKAEFLSTISHEIRTPLNAIVGIGNLLHKTSLNDLQKEYARILQLSSENLLELVNNLLDLSKLDAQKVKLEERVFSLKNLLEVLIHSFKIRAAEKNIELKTEFPEGLPDHLLGDPVKLNQVLTNLLGNAIKFTGKGFVKLEIDLQKSEKEKVGLQFSVSDTGIGVPADKLEAIFQEFSQASYDVNLEFGGTGLGLTISQKLLQMHGSELKVESEEGKGSKFSFFLEYKLSNMAPEDHRRTRVNEVMAQSGAKILVVDDNLTNLFIISQYLQEWKLDHTTVNSGAAAIDAIKKKHYDIVLMDLHMPKMDGYETSTRIGELEPNNKPVIIALSASGRGDVSLKMSRAGISVYVPKPFDPAELQDIILHFLNENSKDKPGEIAVSSTNPDTKPSPDNLSTEDGKGAFSLTRLLQVSNQNPDILQKLLRNSLNSVQRFKEEFTDAATQSDSEKLDDLIHKNKMNLHYIQAEKLADAVESYRKLLEDSEAHQRDLPNKKQEILHEFEKIISGLKAIKREDLS
ncbi:PAS domain-containing hybrid sensor histidine kinase/response regulator [Salinimicrobium terrae]|uniref:PAS domain-containing hybrid sensor histidine kinase/response regulator n=1 Tax=Salinimicrobium terrae TaxID=470866 RepID=UPI000409FEFD|nr:PAS domain-containing hybrid sensor histidine kinase/response regulator [Salinimicrobium terrae]